MIRSIVVGVEGLKTVKPYVPRSTYRRLYGYDAFILVDLRKTLQGLIQNRFRNLLVQNFWQLLIGYLGNAYVDAVNTGAGWYPLRSGDDVGYARAYLAFGTDTTSPAFNQYALGSRNTALEGSAITPTIVSEADKLRLRFGRVTAGSVNEVGLYQVLYDTWGGTQETMHGRVVTTSIPSGVNVYYDVIVKQPFLMNFARYLFGLLSETNQTVKDRGGASVTARTSGDANYEASRLLIGTSGAAFDFGNYELTNPVELTSAYNIFWVRGSYSMVIISGATRLASAMDIYEVGIAQRIYDTGGGVRDVLLARIVLSSPISRAAGDVFSCAVTLYAGV
jgi:hypothetical protein